MYVETFTPSPTCTAPNELPKSNDTSLSATANNEGGNAFDLSLELAEILASFPTPESTEEPSELIQVPVNVDSNDTADENACQAKPPSIGGNLNKRENHRHPLRWQVAIVNKSGGKHDIFHGRTHDVSLSGVSILLERNISFTSEVVILLSIPPMHLGQKKTIIEIQCSTTYTLLDSVHNQFRLGMKFIHFKRDGKEILSDILSKRHIPKDTIGSYAEAEYFAAK